MTKLKRLYMAVTGDEFELPLAVSDNMLELSRMTGISYIWIRQVVCKGYKANRRKKVKIISVLVDEDC